MLRLVTFLLLCRITISELNSEFFFWPWFQIASDLFTTQWVSNGLRMFSFFLKKIIFGQLSPVYTFPGIF